jgi:hypothetical protein
MILSAAMSVRPSISTGVSTSKMNIETRVGKEVKTQLRKNKVVDQNKNEETNEGIKIQERK